MRVIFTRTAITMMVAMACSIARAEVELPNIFTDSMVLQRNQENVVWGKADAGEAVAVHIGDQQKSTKADSDGNWKVTLA
ncbi:MAG: hypothetical protein L7U72_16710, partial [Rubripirellula sp.]|nr:hypothetical protein [Rubripirellula sp.]